MPAANAPSRRRRNGKRLAIAGALLLAPALALLPGRVPTGRTNLEQRPAGNFLANGREPRLQALLINGGASPARNYQSHLLHLRALVTHLRARGVALEDIAVFASDGADPARDLAVRNPDAADDFWIIDALPLRGKLANRIRLVDSAIEGVTLRPATSAAIGAWFAGAPGRLQAGDTLLVYVTDHGRKNAANPGNNAISLWHEELQVETFRRMLARVPQGVRVVMVMSQCFSGAFARALWDPSRPGAVYGDVCGYFSSTAERPAYGCYPENRGRENVGHSFRLFEALARTDDVLEAHGWVNLADRTPDVPHRTSDAYGRELLVAAAARAGVAFDRFVDSLLAAAYRDDHRYGTSFAAIDELGEAFGAFGPRSLDALEAMAANIPRMAENLDDYARAWREALFELEREHYARFLLARPHWRDGVEPELLDALSPKERRSLTRWLTGDLVAFAREERPETWERLLALKTLAEESRLAAYRMRVREAAVLRLRMMLERIAAEVWLRREGSDAELGAWEALEACEGLSLGPRREWSDSRRPAPAPYPPLARELELIEGVLPGWIGVDFAPTDAGLRSRHGLSRGAVTLTRVEPGSPAATSGLRPGDVVVGEPGRPFEERSQLREWAMTSLAGQRRPLEKLRNEEPRVFDLRIGRRQADD